jgi:hypothetical protein
VNDQGLGITRESVGAVLNRQAGQKPRWVDRDLGREADQAACTQACAALPVDGDRDDEQRVVELRDQLGEVSTL